MSAAVARGHDGGDDAYRPPPHPIGTGYRGVGGRKATEGGRGGGRDGRSKGIRKETRNLGLKKIMDEYGPLKIQFEWNDKGTMLHLGENSARWSNLVGEIQHFDLIPHIRSKLWPDIKKGIDQHMAKVYVYNKSALKAKRWTIDEARVQYEEMLRLMDLGANTPMGVPITVDQIMAMDRKGKQREHIHRVGRVLAGKGRNVIFIDKPRGTYTDVDVDELKEEAKRTRRELQLLRTVVRSDDRMSEMLIQLESQHEIGRGSGSGSGGGGDDELGEDEDVGGDEKI
ncbi:hypothetical protein Tco_0444691 [Tanacetum coccineum]